VFVAISSSAGRISNLEQKPKNYLGTGTGNPFSWSEAQFGSLPDRGRGGAGGQAPPVWEMFCRKPIDVRTFEPPDDLFEALEKKLMPA